MPDTADSDSRPEPWAGHVSLTAPFDLMVDDLERYRERLLALGHAPGEITSNPFHRSFTVREPGGHRVTVNSSHATGLPV